MNATTITEENCEQLTTFSGFSPLYSESVFSDIESIYPGIEKTPNVCWGKARIKDTRIPVWVLICLEKMGMSSKDIIDAYPTITRNDLANAKNYYNSNLYEIDLQILENQ